MKIHRAGFRILAIYWTASLALSLAMCLIGPVTSLVIGGILMPIGLLMLWFFRIPIRTQRPSACAPGEVTAVSDGKVVLIEEVFEDEFLSEPALKVSVFLSIFNVHAQWAPLAGRLEYLKYHPGKYLVAWHPKSSTLNERTTFVIDSPQGRVLFRQVAGAVARRLRWYVQPGSDLDQGQEVGFILFGSRIDFYLPIHAELQVELGQKVRARETVIARLPSK